MSEELSKPRVCPICEEIITFCECDSESPVMKEAIKETQEVAKKCGLTLQEFVKVLNKL